MTTIAQKPHLLMIALLLTCALTPSLHAEMCANDVVPAATLLVPYFEVDLNQVDGRTTLISINNSGPQPMLGHITLWTDWSQPTIDFDVFMTGYDVITLNMRDVFNGNIPITADEQSDAMDDISPHGNHPEWDGSFGDCENFFPFFNNPVIVGNNLERLINGHTGVDVLGQGCMGSATGDNVARGFVTIDSARRCSIEFPNELGYFGGIDPVADDRNALWGDFYLVSPESATAVGAPLVHIEADGSFDDKGSPSGYTFYGRFTQGVGATDHREPLGAAWGAGYSINSEAGAATDWVVWRDPSANDVDYFYTCGEGPSWVGLNTDPIPCFDEQENFVEVCLTGDCLPLATQRTPVGDGDLATPFDAGWCRVDFTTRDPDGGDDVDFPVGDPNGELGQGWVGSLYSLDGVYSGGLTAVQLSSACETAFGTNLLGLFRDGFESGDSSFWSSSVP